MTVCILVIVSVLYIATCLMWRAEHEEYEYGANEANETIRSLRSELEAERNLSKAASGAADYISNEYLALKDTSRTQLAELQSKFAKLEDEHALLKTQLADAHAAQDDWRDQAQAAVAKLAAVRTRLELNLTATGRKHIPWAKLIKDVFNA